MIHSAFIMLLWGNFFYFFSILLYGEMSIGSMYLPQILASFELNELNKYRINQIQSINSCNLKLEA